MTMKTESSVQLLVHPIDARLARWHAGDGDGVALHAFLGLTWADYTAWASRRLSDDVAWEIGQAQRRRGGDR